MIEKITENEWKFINEILLQIHGSEDIDNMRKDNIHGLKIKCLYIGLKRRIEMKYIVQ